MEDSKKTYKMTDFYKRAVDPQDQVTGHLPPKRNRPQTKVPSKEEEEEEEEEDPKVKYLAHNEQKRPPSSFLFKTPREFQESLSTTRIEGSVSDTDFIGNMCSWVVGQYDHEKCDYMYPGWQNI